MADIPSVDPGHRRLWSIGVDSIDEQLCTHCGLCSWLPDVHSGCAQH